MKPNAVKYKVRCDGPPVTRCGAALPRSNPCHWCRQCERSGIYFPDGRTSRARDSFDPVADRSFRRASCKFLGECRNNYPCGACAHPNSESIADELFGGPAFNALLISRLALTPF